MEERKDQELTEREEQEVILPEGFGEGDDYFQEESWGKGNQKAEEQELEIAGEEEKNGEIQETSGKRNLRTEAAEYFAKHPGRQNGSVPAEVLHAWLNGTGLGEAFAEYERGRSRAEARRLQHENQVLRQNAAAALRAPVRGVGGGGDTKQEPEDPFLAGFNDERW